MDDQALSPDIMTQVYGQHGHLHFSFTLPRYIQCTARVKKTHEYM